jgi:hypothetical protein
LGRFYPTELVSFVAQPGQGYIVRSNWNARFYLIDGAGTGLEAWSDSDALGYRIMPVHEGDSARRVSVLVAVWGVLPSSENLRRYSLSVEETELDLPPQTPAGGPVDDAGTPGFAGDPNIPGSSTQGVQTRVPVSKQGRGDIDVFGVKTEADHIYRFGRSSNRCASELISFDGNVLAPADQSIEYRAATDGVRYYRRGDDVQGGGGEVWLVDLGEDEAGVRPCEGDIVTVNVPFSGINNGNDDTDWYQVDLTGGRSVMLDYGGNPSRGAELITPDGEVVVGRVTPIGVFPAGRYSVGVSGEHIRNDGWIAPDTIAVLEGPADLHGDTAATATSFTTVNKQVEPPFR